MMNDSSLMQMCEHSYLNDLNDINSLIISMMRRASGKSWRGVRGTVRSFDRMNGQVRRRRVDGV